MRIISKKSDVYDLQHSLFDEDRTWVREEEVFQVRVNKDTDNLVKRFVFHQSTELNCYPVQIASEIHWLLKLKWTEQAKNNTLETFDTQEVQNLINKYNWTFSWNMDSITRIEQIKQRLSEVTPLAKQILGKLNVPLSMITEVVRSKTDDTKYFRIVTNFSFNEHKIPWQEIDSNLYRLHQTLESYIWGVIGNGEKQTVEVSDLDRLKAYGFDEKFSFRNRGK